MRLTSVTPNTHDTSDIRASMGRTPVIFLQAQQSCAILSFIPMAFMSLSTQLLLFLLGAPLPTTPVTFILVRFTQSFFSFRSTCPTFSTLLSGSCSLHIQCPNDSRVHRYASYLLKTLSTHPSYHHLSALPNLARSSTFIAQVSQPTFSNLVTLRQLSVHGNVGESFWWWDALPHTTQLGLGKRRFNLETSSAVVEFLPRTVMCNETLSA